MTEAECLNAELSLLAFQRRVLSLAENPATPLLERLRFLGIVTSNLDELYMLRMAELRRDAVDSRHDEYTTHAHGYSPEALLDAVEREVTDILAAQSRCATDCLAEAAQHGVHLLQWPDLTEKEQRRLSKRYQRDIQPDLRPLAITLSPGHPLPHMPHFGLFVAVLFRAAEGERQRLGEHELPRDMPRLLAVPGRAGSVIPIEEVLRAHAHLLYPNHIVDGAWLFRVTRGGDLPIQEEEVDDLLHSVARAAAQRPHNPAVRVEVERGMPANVGERILESLRREALGRDTELTVRAVQRIDGLLDQRCLSTLPLPDTGALEYPPFTARTPFARDRSCFAAIREGDVLVHHPFESFAQSVVRFLEEAARDAAVREIRITLYRVGKTSPVADALLEAARAGKRVFVLVELRARFDEEHNVQWARAIEQAGGTVMHGVPGLKVHAKAALVTREEDGRIARYVHVSSGNYSMRAGKHYTDLSLFSAREALATDVADLFDALKDSSRPPQGLAHGALTAPHQLLPALLDLLAREAEHAKAGRPSGVRLKVNGLADTELVRALYATAQAGVPLDLVVRGMCTLRPGVPGLSESARVVAVVGRFLEHSRVFRFENGGHPQYFIGSSDLRSRNLRRRVELLVPVVHAEQQARLDALLSDYLNDPSAWELDGEGRYTARAGAGLTTQDRHTNRLHDATPRATPEATGQATG